MSQAHNRSLSLALGRLRFAVVTSCWVIALCLVAQIVVWSLCTFTELRHTDVAPPDGVPLIVDGDKKPAKSKKSDKAREAAKKDARWRPESGDGEEPVAVSPYDRVFKISVTVARTMALMGSLLICPLMALGVILGVPAGAPKVERAVNALIWGLVLACLAMPLGGWFGMAWKEGSVSSYDQMVAAVDAANAVEEGGFSPAFWGRFLLLPAASAAGFILVGLQFSSAVVAVLLKRQVFDPELEKEASNVAATSLHGTGRSAGALTKALQADKAKKKKKQAQSIGRMSAGDAPKRLI
ncbi:MAG: hypothetical protein ACYS15_18250 [Planctomycetota bacterium]|jgi:hypothetical protein